MRLRDIDQRVKRWRATSAPTAAASKAITNGALPDVVVFALVARSATGATCVPLAVPSPSASGHARPLVNPVSNDPPEVWTVTSAEKGTGATVSGAGSTEPPGAGSMEPPGAGSIAPFGAGSVVTPGAGSTMAGSGVTRSAGSTVPKD